MTSLDVDEYIIAVGKDWESIRDWLQNVTATEKDTQILSFFQTRALPNIDAMVPYTDDALAVCKDAIGKEVADAKCLEKVRLLEYLLHC
jgi:hypothetical protein